MDALKDEAIREIILVVITSPEGDQEICLVNSDFPVVANIPDPRIASVIFEENE